MTNIRTQGVCALLVAGVLFFGAPVQALTLDAEVQSLWKQVAELQKQIAELKAQSSAKAVEPVTFAAAVATSTDIATSTEAKLEKHRECMKKRAAQKRNKITCFYEW